MSGRPNTLLSRKYKWAQPGKSVTRWPCNMTVSAHLITHRMTGVKLKAHGVENRGADFRSRKSESFLHDMRSESRFRFSTPKIGAGFQPRVCLQPYIVLDISISCLHVLYPILPAKSYQPCNLRSHSHNFTLIARTSNCNNCSFITCMFFTMFTSIVFFSHFLNL